MLDAAARAFMSDKFVFAMRTRTEGRRVLTANDRRVRLNIGPDEDAGVICSIESRAAIPFD